MGATVGAEVGARVRVGEEVLYDASRRTGFRMPLAQAIYIMMEVCRALTYAHTKKDTEGRPLLQTPMHSSTWSAGEQYCATCRRWFLVEGVVGALRWMAEHGSAHDALPLEVHPNGY